MKYRGNNWPRIAGLKVVFAALLSVNVAAYAQDVVPQTPPELRDFKLDPEKPKPEPRPLPQDTPQAGPVNSTPRQPQPEPVGPQPVTPRPAPRPVITVPDVTPTAQRRSAPAPVQERSATATSAAPVPKSSAITAPPTAGTASPQQEVGTLPPATAPVPELQTDPSVTPPTGPAPMAETDTVSANAPAPFPYWWIAIAAAAIAGAIILFLRRRKTVPYDAELYETQNVPVEPEYVAPDYIASPAPLAAAQITAPLTLPIPAAATGAPKRKDKRPDLDISFIPEKATLSLAKLTIKGQIRIINNGNAEAKSMQLRAAIISANVHQEHQIEAFHSHSQTPGDEIGAATIGERIAMDIDLIIPLSELSSFAMDNKQLFAPIVVAHVDYTWGNGTAHKRDIAKISCLIGREATPPKPKMAPLRLDLGPRSFTPLGQRPLFA
jgi:hypothetical protein